MIVSPKRIAVLVIAVLACTNVAVADTFDDLRSRAIAQLTGGSFDPSDADIAPAVKRISDQATVWANSIITTTGRTSVFPDVNLTASDPSTYGITLGRLQSISVAWATPGTAQYNDTATAQKVLSALQLVNDRGYNAQAVERGNWWFWEIGGPKSLLINSMILYDLMPAQQRAQHLATVQRWCPDPDNRVAVVLKETGANRADKVTIVAYHGIVAKNATKLAMARDGLSDKSGNGANSLFKYVTSGDGFYRDGSFIQHGYIPYTGSYGVVLLGNVASIFSLLKGSTWAVTDPAASLIYDSVNASFSPVVKDGLMMDTVRGRGVSRQMSTDRNSGQDTIASVIELAKGAPDSYAAGFKQLAKGWLQRGNPSTFYSVVSPARAVAAKALLSDSSVSAANQLVGSFVFPNMDRVVHRRPDWSFAVSMNSKRIAPIEWGNGENKHGWYQGDGMTYLYNSDLAQFNDNFRPTVTSYRLPGITVDTRPREDLTSAMTYPRSNVAFVGGTALENRYTAAAMDFAPTQTSITLRAKKSWFLFDDVVVALGAGITSTDGRTIETVVENRNLHQGNNALTTSSSTWAHLDGTAGYVFLNGTAYKSLRETRNGTWRAIDDGGDTAGDTQVFSNNYATIWIDHGVSPANATYAYAILPGASPAVTSSWAAAPDVSVLANNESVQAVTQASSGVYLFNFWTGATVAGYTASGPASIVIRRAGDTLNLAASDPSRSTTSVTLTVPYAVSKVTVATGSATVKPGQSGQSVITVTF